MFSSLCGNKDICEDILWQADHCGNSLRLANKYCIYIDAAKQMYTVEPHLAEHTRDQALLFAQQGFCSFTGVPNKGLFHRMLEQLDLP